MFAFRCLLTAIAVFVLLNPTSAQEKMADLIVGKWETKEKEGDKEITGTIEFTKEGKIKVTFAGYNIDGSYKVIDEKEIEVTMTFMGETRTDKSDVKIEKDSMEIKSKAGKTTKFTRAK